MLAESLSYPFEEIFSLPSFLFGDVARHGREVTHDTLLPAIHAAQKRDRRAPPALTGDRPLETVVDHRADAVLAVGRDPRDAASDLGHRAIAQSPEVDEPLVRRPEDDGVLAAPAVGVGMRGFPRMEEKGAGVIALRVRREGDRLVGRARESREDGLARVVGGRLRRHDAPAAEKLRRVRVVVPALVHRTEGRVVDLEAGAPHDLVVVAAVAGSGVDEAGAVRRRDVLAREGIRNCRMARTRTGGRSATRATPWRSFRRFSSNGEEGWRPSNRERPSP